MDRIVHFSTDITAADTERRTIVGTVVPYGTVGNTSLGPVRFQPGSVRASDTVKLVLEHDMKRPIGRATGFVDGPDRLVGSFRLSHTTAGSDALVEASDGLRDGLSVGARIIEHTIDDSGTMVVSAADLVEVSLVHTPAFSEAVVTQVAASAEDDDTPTTVQEDNVENETTEVAAAEVAASPVPVEAARPSIPYITAQPRDAKNITAGAMLMHHLRAMDGNQDSADVVKYVNATQAEQTTVRDAGVIPVPLLREIVALVDANRPFVDAINRQPLPPSGMSFRVPRVTTSATVAEQTSEFDELDSTLGQIQDFTVDVKTFGGSNDISRQLIDRSDPSYFEELLRQLAQSYAHVTDKFAYDTVKSTALASGSSGSSLYTAVTRGIADSYGVMRFAPDTIVLAPAGDGPSWLDFLQAEDGEERPLFMAANPSNAAGLISQGTTQGTIAGLRVVVDPHIGQNEAARVFPSAFATFYESAGAPIRVEVQQPSTFSVRVAVGGYVAALAKFPTAIRVLAVTS